MDQRYHLSEHSSTGISILSLGLIILFSQPVNAQTTTGKANNLLFRSDEPIEITLLSNFQKLFHDRGEDRTNHRGSIYYLAADQDTIYRKVKLKTRGNFRRDSANCKYPPIRVKFGQDVPEDSLFMDQSKLKLVIQCQIEKYVLLEYLAYRIYNVITENSYKVRLAHITYADRETRVKYATKYGFFIESQDQLEDRLDAENYNRHIVQYMVGRKEVITMALFQFLIGNDDWYVTSNHNITTLQDSNSDDFVVVPYDFDWSSLVDASYTKPEGVSNSKLKERRIYRGLCMTREEYVEQQSIFNNKKEAILDLVNDIPELSTKDRNRAKLYIRQFYSILNKSASYSDIFSQGQCIVEHEIGGVKKSLTK